MGNKGVDGKYSGGRGRAMARPQEKDRRRGAGRRGMSGRAGPWSAGRRRSGPCDGGEGGGVRCTPRTKDGKCRPEDGGRGARHCRDADSPWGKVTVVPSQSRQHHRQVGGRAFARSDGGPRLAGEAVLLAGSVRGRVVEVEHHRVLELRMGRCYTEAGECFGSQRRSPSRGWKPLAHNGKDGQAWMCPRDTWHPFPPCMLPSGPVPLPQPHRFSQLGADGHEGAQLVVLEEAEDLELWDWRRADTGAESEIVPSVPSVCDT